MNTCPKLPIGTTWSKSLPVVGSYAGTRWRVPVTANARGAPISSTRRHADAAEVEAISDGLPYSNTRHFGSGSRPVHLWRPRCPEFSASKPSRATHKSGRASAQAVWLRRRRSSINEPIASPPSATTGTTKRALRIVPPHCRSDGKSTAAGNLNHLSRPDGSCLAGWRAARNSRWNCLVTDALTAHWG
jgi:hypothetical protein